MAVREYACCSLTVRRGGGGGESVQACRGIKGTSSLAVEGGVGVELELGAKGVLSNVVFVCLFVAGVAWYAADFNNQPQWAQDIIIMLRATANVATGGALCGSNLYSQVRVRNLVYCPATPGIGLIRIERFTPALNNEYLYVSEIEVFRGGEFLHWATACFVLQRIYQIAHAHAMPMPMMGSVAACLHPLGKWWLAGTCRSNHAVKTTGRIM